MDPQRRGAMVTGGLGDLGAAICATLAPAGCCVAVGYVWHTTPVDGRTEIGGARHLS